MPKVKAVMVYSPNEGIFRVGRVTWTVGTVGNGKGYSCKLSLAVKRHFPYIRVKLHKSYGGIYA